MISTRQSILTFPFSGFISGVCSGISVLLPPLGIIAPGIFFGIAIAYSVDASIARISFRQRIAIMLAATGGYLAAIVASLLSARFPGFDNGLFYGMCAGTIAGGVGSAIVATTLVMIIPTLSPLRTSAIVTLAGACFGAVFVLCGIYISDRTSWGHPFDDIVTFPLWQTGVASVMPLCLRNSPPTKAASAAEITD